MVPTTATGWLGRLRYGHFSSHDGGLHDPDGTLIDARLMELLDEAREQAGASFIATSGYRPPAVNAAAGGASDSAHLPDPVTRQAYAVDGYFVGMPLLEQLLHVQRFPFFGVGLYPYAPPGRDPSIAWTPVIHVDRKNRKHRFNEQAVWIRNRAGVYVYWPSDEFKTELHALACPKGDH
jgi:Peptidase M15